MTEVEEHLLRPKIILQERGGCLLGNECQGIGCSECWSFRIKPKQILNNVKPNNNTSVIVEDEDEHVPLTLNTIDDDDHDDQPCFNDQYEDDGSDDDEDVGYTYQHGRNGYATLHSFGSKFSRQSSGRVSMHDSWDFDNSNPPKDYDKDESNGRDRSDSRAKYYPEEDEEEEDENGDFISFWHQNDSSTSFDESDNEEQTATTPQHLESPYAESHTNIEDESDEDDRVETTMRPIPLFHRNRGGLGHNTIKQFGWFQRELGHWEGGDNADNNNINQSRRRGRRRNRPWGWGRRQQSSMESDFDNSEDENEDRIQGGDTNSLLASTSSTDEIGHCIAIPDMSAYDQALANAESNAQIIKPDNNIFGNNRRGRGGILALPIVRPFLRGGPTSGFIDNNIDDVVEDDDDRGEDDIPSRRDRIALQQSISQGISGTNNDMLLLDASELDINSSGNMQSSAAGGRRNRPPNFLEKIFITRFLQPPGGSNENIMIQRLHNLLRKEDWSLATNLLESNPDLSQTWYNVDRLYGGRFDGEALPIHAACALCPPASFLEMLANLYPEGLLEKDKAFGRVPLHVACRSLAHSSVIQLLCKMEPTCVEERDTLKRVPLHYLIKNYCTFGSDDDDVSIDDEGNIIDVTTDDDTHAEESDDKDGMKALKILIKANINCVHAADHRGWLPIHVACSCSSRKGMIRVMKLLLKCWPESVNSKTDKDSDVFDCVDMSGKHHPTKDQVVALLKEAKDSIIEGFVETGDGDSESSEAQDGEDSNDESGDDKSALEQSGEEESASPQIDLLSPQPDILSETNVQSNEDESDNSTASSSEEKTRPSCPEGVLLRL